MTGPYSPGMIVGISHKGRDFMALVEQVDGQELTVKPLMKNINYYHVSVRDVKVIYRKTRGQEPYVREGGMVSFAGGAT